jgi:pimeloyl-ACP methyl ester carboxylesterase
VAVLAAGVLVLAVAGYGLVSSRSRPTADEPVAALSPTTSERVSEFVGAGGQRLGGTLTLPPATAGAAAVPAVLLVPGLGAIDRNAVVAAGTPDATRDALAASMSMSALGGVEPMFQDVARALAAKGIASFRYDKRGTAASKSKPDTKLSFDDEVADARAALDFLAQRQEVGAAPIAVMGHDQGGVVAMRVAAGNPRVKALVAVSTPARPLADALADDLTRTRGAESGQAFRSAVATLQATGKAPAPDSLPALLQPLFPVGQDAYLKAILALDPAAEASAVTVPALVVRGGADESLNPAEADRLAGALRAGAEVMAGSPTTDRNLALAGAGHVHSNMATGPVSNSDAELTSRLAGWLQTKLRA